MKPNKCPWHLEIITLNERKGKEKRVVLVYYIVQQLLCSGTCVVCAGWYYMEVDDGDHTHL